MLEINISLSEYYQEVRRGKFSFPDYSFCCPICEGKDCCIFHGYYYRQVIDEKGTYFKEFPIARYICTDKGKKETGHKTFSLLPYKLIPYSKYSIDYIFMVINFWRDNSNFETFRNYEEVSSIIQLYRFLEIIKATSEKSLVSEGEAPEDFVEFCNEYISSNNEIRGPTGLNLDYYIRNGRNTENSQFLFGTAFQFR